MVERCRARLAAVGATAVRVTCCAWEDLADHFGPDFDAVLCLGNSLSHAPSPAARRAALTCFAATLVPGGTLILDVQDWTAVHARGSWHDVDPLVVTRDGIRCRRTYDWTVGDRFGDPVSLEITLDLQGPDEEHRASHTMTFLPFTPEQLLADLAAMDFVDLALHQDPGDDRCSVTASFTRRG
jgi:SAM-dependent methyltransferase